MVVTPKALRRSLERRSLSRFARAMMPSYEVTKAHALIIEYVERLLRGDIKRLWIAAPPRHGKTLIGSIFTPAFALGRDPREMVMEISYGADLSETWGRRVRNLLADPTFKELFPSCQLSPDSQAAFRFETTLGGEFVATGRNGPLTGKGATLCVLDDLVKDFAEGNSEAVCRATQEWIQSVVMTRLSPNARVLAIGTRWSQRDAMSLLLEQSGWHVLNLPAICDSDHDPLGRPIGAPLWENRFPLEVLEKIKADVGSRVFQCLYQGRTEALEGTLFKRQWFRHFQTVPEKFRRIIQSWDTAFKTGATNDYSVCVTIGETDNGFYLLHLFRDKIEFPELKRKVSELADAYKPEQVLVEDRASGQSLIQELKASTSYAVIPVRTDRDKETRASAVTAYFEAGRVFFPDPTAAAWVNDVEDELSTFPGGLHDDIVDAISQCLNRMRDSGGSLGMVEFLKTLASGARNIVSNRYDAPKQTAAPGQLPSDACCGDYLPQNVSGMIRCGNCGKTKPAGRVWAAGGMNRTEFEASLRQSGNYGRFG